MNRTKKERAVMRNLTAWNKKMEEQAGKKVSVGHTQREEECAAAWGRFWQELRWLRMESEMELLNPQEHLKARAAAWKNLEKEMKWYRSFDALRELVWDS